MKSAHQGTVLTLVILISITSACGPVSRLLQPQDDLDRVVNEKGIPLMIREASGKNRAGQVVHLVTLVYRDSSYTFVTNAERTAFRTETTVTSASPSSMPQQTIPRWFRDRYPNLNWDKIRIR